jgi:hypothetical protein
VAVEGENRLQYDPALRRDRHTPVTASALELREAILLRRLV